MADFPIFPVGGKKPVPPTLLGVIANLQAQKRVTSRIDPRPAALPKGIDFAGLKKMTDALASQKRVTSPIPAVTRIAQPQPKPRLTTKQAVGHLVQGATAAAKPGGVTLPGGQYLPPGIDFGALKAAAPPKPTDALADIYNKFKADMALQGKDASKRLDDVIKAVGGYYDEAGKATDAAYAPVQKELQDLVTNVGGPANASSYGNVTSAVAQIKSLLASQKAGNMGSLSDLKGADAKTYEAMAQGLQQTYLDAILARMQMQLDQQAAAAGGGSGGGGGGGRGGGGYRRYRSGGGGGGSSGKGGYYTDSANETYTSYDDYADIMNDPNLTPGQKAQAQRAIILGGGNAVNVMKTLQNQLDAVSRTRAIPKRTIRKGAFGVPQYAPLSNQQKIRAGVDLVKKAGSMGSLAQLMAKFLPHAPYLGGASVKRTAGSKRSARRYS